MKTFGEVLGEAREEFNSLGFPDRLERIQNYGVSMVRNTLGEQHGVYWSPPYDSLMPISKETKEAILERLRPNSPISLYINIPFCEMKCTFCIYDVELYRGRKESEERHLVQRYLQCLTRELAFYAGLLAKKNISIKYYSIGGGTPLVVEKEDLRMVMNFVKDYFALEPNIAIVVEGSPITIIQDGGEEKLRLLKELGVTRFSFGVQSFKDQILKSAGRANQGEMAQKACQIVSKIFPDYNIDLIQSLYNSSLEDIFYDLGVIEKIRPSDIYWYFFRHKEDTIMSGWFKNPAKKHKFPDDLESLVGRLMIWRELSRMGYITKHFSYFQRPQFEKVFAPIALYRPNAVDLLGTGTSARSICSLDQNERVFYRNIKHPIRKYIELIEETGGIPPIHEARFLDFDEQLANLFCVLLRYGLPKSKLNEYYDKVQPATREHYQTHIKNLINLGVLDIQDDKISFTRMGRLFENEVLASFWTPAVIAAIQKK